MDQEILQKAMMLRGQSEEIEKQIGFVSEQVQEMEIFLEGLNELAGSDKEEILANLGRGVYVKANRLKEEKLFVEVGAGIMVRKTPAEAKGVVEGQLKKFKEAEVQLKGQLEQYADEFREMLGKVQEMREEKDSSTGTSQLRSAKEGKR